MEATPQNPRRLKTHCCLAINAFETTANPQPDNEQDQTDEHIK